MNNKDIIEQLKSMNKELKSDNSMLLAQADADAFTIGNLNFKIQKLQQCLDEIEEYCKEEGWQNYSKHFVETSYILQKIKEVKG